MPRLGKHARWIPGGVFTGLAALCVLMGAELFGHFRAEQQLELLISKQHVERRLTACIADRVALLEHDADNWLRLPIRDRTAFEELSAAVQARFAGFQALSWMDTQGIIRWVVPLAGNERVVDLDINRHPGAARTFATARATRRTAITPPIDLIQGGTGFALYVPLLEHGEITGYFNGVFRIEPLVKSCLFGDSAERTPVDARIGFELRWQGRSLVRWGDTAPPVRPPETWSLEVGAETWEGAAWLPAALEDEARWVHLVPLLLGLAMTLAVTLAVRWALVRQAAAEGGHARAHTLLEHAPEAIVVYAPATRAVVQLNAPARRLLAPDPAAVATLIASLPGAYLTKALDGVPVEFEHVFDLNAVRADLDRGEQPCEIRIVRLPGGEQEQVRISLIDIRERRRVAQERERLLNVLAAQADQLQGVVYAAAHDLRTPLVGIGGHVGLLRESLGVTPTPEVQTSLTGIERQVTNLDRMLGGLGRLAEVGRRSLCFERLDADQQAQLALAELSPPPGVEVRIEGPLPGCVADADLLRMVFRELIDNAVRHAPRPGLPCHVVVRAEVAQAEVAYVVEDDGCGLSEHGLHGPPDLFRRERSGQTEGSGLGLAIVQRALTRMGGRLALSGSPEGGTQARAVLPTV